MGILERVGAFGLTGFEASTPEEEIATVHLSSQAQPRVPPAAPAQALCFLALMARQVVLQGNVQSRVGLASRVAEAVPRSMCLGEARPRQALDSELRHPEFDSR